MLKRLLLLIVLLVASGCDHWMEKLAPGETSFARHCFELLQHRDFAAIEALAAPALRTADLPERLSALAAQIPAEAPISSDAVSFNVSTVNGYTTSTVGMVYQFQSGWLEFDTAAEGSGTLALTAISLRPTEAPTALEMTPFLLALPPLALIAVLIVVIVQRRRRERREALQMTPATHERRREWRTALDEAPTPGLLRFLGMRRIELTAPLGPEQCKQRLRDSIEGEWILFRWGKALCDFQGKVGTSGFRISQRGSLLTASRYQTFLYGSLVPDGAATRLRCTLGPQRLLFGLSAVFLLFAWTAFPTFLFAHGNVAQALLSLLFPLVVTAGMAIGFAMGGKRIQKEGPVLLDFLGKTLGATEATAPRSGSIERVVRR